MTFVGKDKPTADLTKADFLAYRDLIEGETSKRQEWIRKNPKPLSEIGLTELRNAPGFSQSTANKYLVLVKGAFNTAERENSITVNGIEKMLKVLRQSKARKRETPLITPEHLSIMLDKLDDKWSLICMMAMNLAGSNADIARLRWNQITSAGVYDWTRDKNLNIRRTPLWNRNLAALEAFRRDSKSETFIFTTSHGNPYQHSSEKSRKDALGQEFTIKMRAMGLPYTFAALRKSACTVALIHGANETVIKMILGDAQDEVWRSYGMTVPEIIQDAIDSIEAHYFGGK